MKTIAFSWLTNTGKSTEIHGNKELWIDGIVQDLRDTWYGTIVYRETARELFDLLPNDYNGINDLTLFQTAIRAMEQARVERIKEKKKEWWKHYSIVDRTYHDSVLFNRWNREQWLSTLCESDYDDLSDTLYDIIILFSTPHKDNNRLNQYNDSDFKSFFSDWIKDRYWDKVVEFENNDDPKYKEWKKSMFGI
jgi:hypothetical protein